MPSGLKVAEASFRYSVDSVPEMYGVVARDVIKYVRPNENGLVSITGGFSKVGGRRRVRALARARVCVCVVGRDLFTIDTVRL